MPRRHGGSLSNDFGRTFVLAATLLAAPALAQAGCWDNCCNTWDEFKRACSCDGGDAYPNPPRCVPRGGGGGYVPPPVPVDPRILQNQRYQKVIDGASGIIDAAYFRGLPTATDAEFARALNTLHQHLWRVAQVSSAGRALFDARSAEGAAFRRNFYEPMRRSLGPGGVARDISAANGSARSELAILEVEALRFKDLHERLIRSGAAATSRRIQAEEAMLAKQTFWVYFGGLSRREVEDVSHAYSMAPKLDSCCEEKPRAGHLIESQKPVAVAETAAVERAAEAYSTARIRIPQSLSGDNETRLAAVEKIQVKALAAFTAELAARNHYEKNWTPAHDQTMWENILDANRMVLDDTHRFASKAIPTAKAGLKHAREFFDAEAWETFKNGAKSITWYVYRKRILEPDIKRLGAELFRDGGPLLSDDDVKDAWSHNRSGLFAAHKAHKRYKSTQELLHKSLSRIEGSFEESSLAMTDVYGHAEVSDVQEIGGRVLADVDGATREEMKKSLDRVDVPDAVLKNWRTYFHGRKW